nr:reverse transcriptase domain-containing protein [Tanacetum cinerariifolium]
MSKYGVTHHLAIAYHPQTSGQVEVSNQGLKSILERTVRENRASWSEKLEDALWDFRTSYKTPIPYKLVYEKSFHLPIELEHKACWALKHANFDLKTVGDHRKLQLNELNELLDQAYENSLIYKEKTKKLHDSKIKNRIFNVGDRVLLFNSRLKIFSRKLKTRWSGPFTIIKVFPYGTVELSQPEGPNFKEKGVIDSGCSRHMTRNMSYLSKYEEIDGGYVAFRGDPKGGKITDTECVILSPNFKLLDESQALLRVPRKNNMYSVDLRNVAPSGGLACLFENATLDESNLWHRRLGHINFKTMNKLKGKQHKATCKTKSVSSISKPLQMLHMDLFGPSFVKSIMKRGIENLIDHKVKIIRCNNRTEFMNKEMNKFYEIKGIRREFSVAGTPQQNGIGPNWMFDIDSLTMSMNYQPGFVENQSNGNAGLKSLEDKAVDGVGKKSTEVPRKENGEEKGHKGISLKVCLDKTRMLMATCYSLLLVLLDPLVFILVDQSLLMLLHFLMLIFLLILSCLIWRILLYDDEVEGAEADFNNLELTTVVSLIPTTRIHKDHPKEQIIGDPLPALQTRRMTKTSQEHVMVSYIKKQRRNNHNDYQNCLLACFLSQIEPKKRLVDLPKGKHAIGNKWVYRNKKDERRIVVRNKARLVAQGYTQEEGIDYDEVFAPAARIEAIRLFLADISIMGFIMYQMDVKSAFLYGIIEEEVYMCQPPGFEDPYFSNKKDDGIFISQDKYVDDILKKFDFSSVKTASTPIETNKALLMDEEAVDIDAYLYRSMIGSLMYLTASRPDIMDSPFDLEDFLDCDYARASLDRKSTTRGCQFLVNEDVQIRTLIDGKKIIVTEASIKCDLQIQVAKGTAWLPNDNIFEELARMGRSGESSEVPTDTYHTPVVTQPSSSQSQKKQKLRRTQRKETEGSFFSQIKNNQGAKIKKLKKRLKKLEGKKKKRTYGIKRMYKERLNEEEMFGVDNLDGDEVIMDVTAGENVEQDAKVAEKEVSTATGEVVTTTKDVEVTTTAATVQISKDDVTLAQTLIEIKATKPMARGVIVQEPSEFRTTLFSQPSQLPHAKDKGKRIMMKAEMEEEKRIARKKDEANIAVVEQWDEVQAKIDADTELAQKLQTEE